METLNTLQPFQGFLFFVLIMTIIFLVIDRLFPDVSLSGSYSWTSAGEISRLSDNCGKITTEPHCKTPGLLVDLHYNPHWQTLTLHHKTHSKRSFLHKAETSMTDIYDFQSPPLAEFNSVDCDIPSGAILSNVIGAVLCKITVGLARNISLTTGQPPGNCR